MSLQLALGAVVGGLLAFMSEPHRAWRFPLLAVFGVILALALVRLQKSWPADQRQCVVQVMALQAIGWALAGFVITELRLVLR